MNIVVLKSIYLLKEKATHAYTQGEGDKGERGEEGRKGRREGGRKRGDLPPTSLFSKWLQEPRPGQAQARTQWPTFLSHFLVPAKYSQEAGLEVDQLGLKLALQHGLLVSQVAV